MADKQPFYRFSIRDLLIVTAGFALLLFVSKRHGPPLTVSLTLTLISGGLFLKGISVWPIQKWKAPFAYCLLLNGVLLGLFLVVGTIRHSYSGPTNHFLSLGIQPAYFLEGGTEIFSLIFATAWLIVLSVFMVCYAQLIWHSKRPILSALLLLMNLSLAALIVNELLRDPYMKLNQAATLQGYLIALAALGLLLVIHWIKTFPTTREEIEAPFEEKESPPDR